MSDKWDKFLRNLMEDDSELDELEFVDPELILEEINKDPELRDVKAPEDLHDRVFAQIREYEEQKRLAELSDEEKELLRLGKIYRKRRKLSRCAVLVAAAVALFAIGTISMGENESILQILSKYLLGGEQVISDTGSTEPIQYVDEEEIYEEIEDTYNVAPVKLRYLPNTVTFQEAVFYKDLQEIYMYYGFDNEANIIYSIKPNYRESSSATMVEDEKKQEYTMEVNETEITVKEYNIVDSSSNRWIVSWVYQDVQYALNISDMEQKEIEKIVNNLRLFE